MTVADQTMLDCLSAPVAKLPCRVVEMTAREFQIYMISAELMGRIYFAIGMLEERKKESLGAGSSRG